MKPRYTAGSVTGYPITYGAGQPRRMATVWYVHDRLNCYRIVREFKGSHAEAKARTLATKLNTPEPARMDAWLAGLSPVCAQGHAMTGENTIWYESRGRRERRCRKCREAFNTYRREQRRARKAAA